MIQINESIKSCQLCALYKNMPFGPVYGIGNPKGKYLIITESISLDDAIVDEPYYDYLGVLCKQLLSESGIDVNSCYFTTYLKCHSPEGLKKEYINKCKHVYTEIQELKPRLIIGFGKSLSKLIKEPYFFQCPSLHFLYTRGKKVWNQTVRAIREKIDGLQS